MTFNYTFLLVKGQTIYNLVLFSLTYLNNKGAFPSSRAEGLIWLSNMVAVWKITNSSGFVLCINLLGTEQHQGQEWSYFFLLLKNVYLSITAFPLVIFTLSERKIIYETVPCPFFADKCCNPSMWAFSVESFVPELPTAFQTWLQETCLMEENKVLWVKA